ncbi:hypothetical protein BJX65DRAFT_308607 [Aspergillus insuetus]
MATSLQREIERLQEKCRRLDFENRRLRRTLRCVDCNSRIADAAAKEQSLATKKARRPRITSSNPLLVDSLTTTDQPTTPWSGDLGQSIAQQDKDEFRFADYLSPIETSLASPITSWNEGNTIFDDVLWSNAHSSSTTGLLDHGSEATSTVFDNAHKDTSQSLEELFRESPLIWGSGSPVGDKLPSALFDSAGEPGNEDTALLQDFGLPWSLDLKEPTLSTLGLSFGFNMGQAQQRMDQYIKALGMSIRNAFASETTPSRALESLVSYGVMWIVREAWPAAEGFWKITASLNGFVQSELWRLFPCQSSYEKLHPAYRPTPLQLTVPHSPLIDWLPWPDLRDRIIELQDQLDVEAVCRSAIESVVAHRQVPSSKEAEATLPTFRVWDLHLLEKKSGVGLTNNQLTYKPRAASVLAMEKEYNLVYDDFLTQRLHPAFFEKCPLITCERLKTKFYVQAISIANGDEVGDPKPFTEMAMIRLKQLVTKRVHGPGQFLINCPPNPKYDDTFSPIKDTIKWIVAQASPIRQLRLKPSAAEYVNVLQEATAWLARSNERNIAAHGR